MEMFSDASNRQLGGASFLGNRLDMNRLLKVLLSEKERRRSSTFCELRREKVEGKQSGGDVTIGQVAR